MPPAGPNPGPEVRGRMPQTGGESYLAWVEFYQGDNMGKIVQFVKESYAELRKVIWPSRDDVISSVKVVIVSTIIIAAVLGLVDVLLLLGVQTVF
jgi:preprotein translocase subunit SecE